MHGIQYNVHIPYRHNGARQEIVMERSELAKMGQAIAEKFRGKAALTGTRSESGMAPPPPEATDRTLGSVTTKQLEEAASILKVPEPTSEQQAVQVLPLELMLESPYQPRRRDRGKKELEQLANNIAANGQTTPIIVTRATGDQAGKYHVQAGQRRCAALRMLGWKTVKAIIRDDLDEREAQRVALMDNLGREDLCAFDQAMGFQEYAVKYGLDGQTAAHELGLSRRDAFRLQAIAKSSPALLVVIRDGGISLHAAERLARVDAKDARRAVRLAKRVVEGTITPEGLDREVAGDSRAKAPRPQPQLADLQVSAKRIYLSVGLRHGPLTAEQKREIQAVLATFLWHAGLEAIEPKQPAGDADLPVTAADRKVA
jgi:ParB/RepB/Spo0J family partition protein